MRRPAAAALLLLLALPAAAAAVLEPQGPRVLEQPVAPGGAAVFDLAVRAQREGSLYAKLLPTPGNAVHDGARANGSAADRTGWWIQVSALLPDGSERALGAFADGARTALVPVREGDLVTFRVAVHAPLDAASGGRVHVAVAYRAPAVDGAGGSGADLEEARAFTLRLVGAGQAPAAGPPATPTPAERPPASPTPAARPPAPVVARAPAAEAVPSPLLVVAVVFLGAIVLLLAAIGTLLALILREMRLRHGARARTVPVREAEAPPATERTPRP